MANIIESNHWSESIYEIATTDDVIGGKDGINNIQANQLAARTNYLREYATDIQTLVRHLETGQTSAGQALKLTNARSIHITGDASGSAGFDGTADVILNLVQKDTGATAGSYRQVTVDVKGRVTAGSNPTTLAGYGITDAALNDSPTITGESVFYSAPADTSAQIAVCGAAGAAGREAKIRFYATFAATPDNDVLHRLTASLRSGFDGGAWGTEYLDVCLNKTGNDADSDTNQDRVARFTQYGIDLGEKTISANTINATGNDSYRHKTSSGATGYASYWRNEGGNLWLLLTNKDDANGSFNNLRPIRINFDTGMVEFCNGTLAIDQDGGTRVTTPEITDHSSRIVNSSWVKNWINGLNYTDAINSAMSTAKAAQASADYANLPAGTRLPFAQAAAPTGWTQINDDATNNRMLRVVNGDGSRIGGVHSPILNNVVPAHTHWFTTGYNSVDHTHIIQDPGHQHNTAPFIGDGNKAYSGGGSTNFGSGGNGFPTTRSNTGISNSGSTTSHTHSGSTDNGSSQTNWQPRYIDMIICVKN